MITKFRGWVFEIGVKLTICFNKIKGYFDIRCRNSCLAIICHLFLRFTDVKIKILSDWVQFFNQVVVSSNTNSSTYHYLWPLDSIPNNLRIVVID